MKTIILTAALALSSLAHANPQEELEHVTEVVASYFEEDRLIAHAMCANWNAMVAEGTISTVSARAIELEADRHARHVRDAIGHDDAAYTFYTLYISAREDLKAGLVNWQAWEFAAEACNNF